jgi:hypothetical protein
VSINIYIIISVSFDDELHTSSEWGYLFCSSVHAPLGRYFDGRRRTVQQMSFMKDQWGTLGLWAQPKCVTKFGAPVTSCLAQYPTVHSTVLWYELC